MRGQKRACSFVAFEPLYVWPDPPGDEHRMAWYDSAVRRDVHGPCNRRIAGLERGRDLIDKLCRDERLVAQQHRGCAAVRAGGTETEAERCALAVLILIVDDDSNLAAGRQPESRFDLLCVGSKNDDHLVQT